ncbi:hypothetical protein [Serratia sp. Se-RSBMAAmG]|uniref:hypothetical protein n=1 Tax=Serratia sp. Se-RSBMAAmG TaxID=3043305 RepID=UPI0024AFBC4E|nr:hypothetical protein [Serratia sp. Se-RSBMAAmG]MDI6976099.1 hypothetical protein [Serratia sp. Se-RSBMAAmG]
MNIKKLYATASDYLLSLLPGDPVFKAMTKGCVEDIQKTCGLVEESRDAFKELIDNHKIKSNEFSHRLNKANKSH